MIEPGPSPVPLPFHIVGEAVSLASIVGAVAQVLPSIATLLAIIWYGVLIFESRTMRRIREAERQIDIKTVEAKQDIKDKGKEIRQDLKTEAIEAKTKITEAAATAAERLIEVVKPHGH